MKTILLQQSSRLNSLALFITNCLIIIFLSTTILVPDFSLSSLFKSNHFLLWFHSD